MIKRNRKLSEIIAVIILAIVIVLILVLFVADNDRQEIGSNNIIQAESMTETKNIIKENNNDNIIIKKKIEFQTEPKVIKEKVISQNDDSSSESATNNQNGMYVAYYGNIPLTQNDMNMMCTIVSSEAGYCDDMAQKAIAHTILNRFNDSRFPNTMYEITTQENQYTAIHSYFDGQYREGLYPGSELWNHSMQLCYETLNEWDFTGGAFAYYNPQMIGYNAWFESLRFTYQNQYARFFTF